MGFLQIITFSTDRFDEFTSLEQAWERDSAGRRTGVGGQVYADRNHPGRYVALDWFDSYDSAMVNSALPETSAFAERAGALAIGPVEFIDLDPVGPTFVAGLAGLRTSLETSTIAPDTFAADVDLDILVPHGRMRETGPADLETALRDEAPGRGIERWEAQPTPTGFVVEYSYRTHGQPSLVAGFLVATLRDGLIARLALSCAGSWNAETEATVAAETGALGPRVPEAVR